VAQTGVVKDEKQTDNVDYDNGKPKHRGQRLDGEMHGAWEFYRRDGSLMRSGEFDRGRQVGTWRTYHRSGEVVSEKRFPNPED
jgi:antitoxin component YwqK of YwqJK toxin-antitoxin module